MEKIKLSEAIKRKTGYTKAGSVLMYLVVAVCVAVFITTGRGCVALELAMGSLIIGVMQLLWQSFALELFTRRLSMLHQEEFDEYPDHISNGGWLLYVLKMTLTMLAALELILSV
jgi:hypothetical protein